MTSLVSIYKSPAREEMYLYLSYSADRVAALEKHVPEALLRTFGKPVHVFDLLLTPEKKLARVAAAKVLQEISQHGYYLQMPPSAAPGEDDYTIRLPDELLTLNDPT